MNIYKDNIILVFIFSAVLLFMVSCSSTPPPPKWKPVTSDCCPKDGGLLDSTVNYVIERNLYPQDLDKLYVIDTNYTDEYAPWVDMGSSYDVLWFASSRKSNGKYETILPAEVYYSTRPVSDRNKCPHTGWSEPKQFSTSSEKFDSWMRGTQTIFDNTMIMTVERPINAQDPLDVRGTSYNLDLWQMTRTGGGLFDDPKALGSNINSDYWESQPCFSEDGKVLFFVSNRPTTKYDDELDKNIWYSVKGEDGQWQETKPLENINTSGDNITPHCGADGMFYFAKQNDGEDFDIFACKMVKQNDIWLPSEPVEMNRYIQQKNWKAEDKFTVNSDADEMSPFVTKDKSAFYYSSNRESGYGGLDIYACKLPPPVIQLIVKVYRQKIDTCGGRETILEDWSERVGIPIKMTEESNKEFTVYSGQATYLKPNTYYTGYIGDLSDQCFKCEPFKENEFTTGYRDTVIHDEIRIKCYQKCPEPIEIDPYSVPYFITWLLVA